MNRDTKYGFCLSLGIHTLALYGFGAVFIEGPEFSMALGGNTIDVELVAAPAPLQLASGSAPRQPKMRKEETPQSSSTQAPPDETIGREPEVKQPENKSVPEPEEKRPEEIFSPKPDDMILPMAEEKSPAVDPPAPAISTPLLLTSAEATGGASQNAGVEADPGPATAAAPLLTSSGGVGDGSSPIAGNDATTLVRGEGGLTDAKPGYLRNPAPIYPERARQMGQEGLVILRVSVTADGLPSRIDLCQSSGFSLLDDAAVSTLRRWKFRPARIGGMAITAEVDVPIRFKLN